MKKQNYDIIIFTNKPQIVVNEDYWYADIEPDKEYYVIDSYEKLINGKSIHFFLIQDEKLNLIEIPLSHNFIYKRK